MHARVSPEEKAHSVEVALDALCKAKVAHRIFHSSGNGVPLSAEQKDNLFKVLFLDVGLMSSLLGIQITDLIDTDSFIRKPQHECWGARRSGRGFKPRPSTARELPLPKGRGFLSLDKGTLAEQWVGQHLLGIQPSFQSPSLYYWVREKAGSMAEVDYLFSHGSRIYPVEVKAGSSLKAQSLQVFLKEKKKSPLGIHFSTQPARYHETHKVLELPFYLIEQLPQILPQISLKQGSD